MTATSEVAILSRMIEPHDPALPVAFARQVLRWKFHPGDRQRMLDLLDKSKNGSLTASEKLEAEKYERIGHFVSILKSKARISLRVKGATI